MKILVIVESKHQGNTLKIAKAMAEEVPITISNCQNAENLDLNGYDIVGFGSGIYMGKHDKRILDFGKSMPDYKGRFFVFSTSGGADYEKNNKALVDILKAKNKEVLGTFACKGLDKFFILSLFGGTNKGSPTATDCKNAQAFIREIVSKVG